MGLVVLHSYPLWSELFWSKLPALQWFPAKGPIRTPVIGLSWLFTPTCGVLTPAYALPSFWV
eukprot:5877239-Amphidinium_carterae.1